MDPPEFRRRVELRKHPRIVQKLAFRVAKMFTRWAAALIKARSVTLLAIEPRPLAASSSRMLLWQAGPYLSLIFAASLLGSSRRVRRGLSPAPCRSGPRPRPRS